jgi:hypothetical protein
MLEEYGTKISSHKKLHTSESQTPTDRSLEDTAIIPTVIMWVPSNLRTTTHIFMKYVTLIKNTTP